MAAERLIFFSVAGLRPGDVDKALTPTLYEWAARGALAELVPTFPCVTSCVQATMWTGLPPGRHGVIANGFFRRDRREVEFWVAHNNVIAGEQIWDALHANRPGLTSAVLHAQNIKGAAADFIVTPAPMHAPDGSIKLWCYSKPQGLYEQMLDALGHFPLQHYWGPLVDVQSTRWILEAALLLIEKYAPNFNWIYIPHLDYAAQKFGPDSAEARKALVELDEALSCFAGKVSQTPVGDGVVYVAAGEYALTDVSGVLYPNRSLRTVGLLNVREEDGKEFIDLQNSAAFAMVDHQVAHIYVTEPRARARGVDLFLHSPGIAAVYAGDDRRKVGMDHERSGDIVLVAEDEHWFAYYWWFDDAAAPPFARTVDIHRKPGFDPVELFVDRTGKGIPLDAGLVKGSHGVPAADSRHRTALICTAGGEALQPGGSYRDTDIKRLVLDLLTAGAHR